MEYIMLTGFNEEAEFVQHNENNFDDEELKHEDSKHILSDYNDLSTSSKRT